MKFYKTLVLVFLLSFKTVTVFAQDAKMADAMRSNGRIYVVVAVVVAILLGLFVYLFRLDRKMSRLERDNRQLTIDN